MINHKTGNNGNGMIEGLRERYNLLIRQREYDEAERVEKAEGIDYRLLNWVISDIIMERNGQSRELVGRFAHRGYGQKWIDEYCSSHSEKPIKTRETGR